MAIFNFNGSLLVGTDNSVGSYTYGCLIGNNLKLGANYQTVVGKYNEVVGSDYIFVVGTGSSSARKNAMTISANGNVNISGTITPSSYGNLPNRVTNITASGNKITFYINGVAQTPITLG